MSEKPIILCSQIEGINCCSSCHNDWDDGFGDPFEDEHETYIFSRCCSPSREPTEQEIETALNAGVEKKNG